MIFIGIDGGGTTTRLFVQHDDEAPEYFERQVCLKLRDGNFAASAEKLREVISAQCLALSQTNQKLSTQHSALSTCIATDRKSTRLNSSHLGISYAVFCLKKTTK